MISYDVKRAVSARLLYVSMLIFVLLAFFTKLDVVLEVFRKNQLLEQGWTVKFIGEILTGKTMLFCLPVLCALPFSSSFIEEYKSGMCKFALSRIDRRTYLVSKVLTTGATGGGILVIGAVTVFAVSILLFLPAESGTGVWKTLNQSMAPFVQLLTRYFCFGALGGITGLWISTAINNRYMAWMAPFMVEYLLIIFCERYFEWCLIFHPKEWLNPSKEWPMDTWSVCLWLMALVGFTAWGFIKTADRRIRSV